MTDCNVSRSNNKGDGLEIPALIIIAFWQGPPSYEAMFQFLSVILGLVCAVLMLLGIIPFLGWMQWAVLAGCVLGVIFGAFCERKIGLTINIAVGVAAIVRLMLGGGLL